MKSFALKIIHKPWFFPLALLLLGGVAYGLIIPSLGFYWDDWEGVYLYFMHNPAISFQYYNNRPVGAIAYLLLFPFAKMTPVVWQVVAFFLRWGASLFFYFALKLVWPTKQRQLRWATALLLVFPGFLEQPVSVAFSQHLVTYLFFASSLFLMILALKQRRLFWLWMPLSILLGGLQVFMMEYFVGLEILRPLLIWFILRQEQKGSLRLGRGETRFLGGASGAAAQPPADPETTPPNISEPHKEKGGRLVLKTLLYWSPFLLVLMVYLYWRLAYLPSTLAQDPNSPTLLKTILAAPLKGLSSLAVMIYHDSLALLLYVWPGAFLDTGKMDIQTKRVWFGWLCGAGAAAAFFLYNKFNPATEQADDQPGGQLIFMGVAAILFGTLPVWATGDQISAGKWSERFTLAPMLGAVILIVFLVDWLFRTHKQKEIFLAILLGISISGQISNQFLYQADWENQRDIYWQLHWRIPSLKAGTALFGKGTFTDKSSYYDALYIVNLLFSKTAGQNAQYAYFDIHHTGFSDYKPGTPLKSANRGTTFSGDTAQAVVFDFGVRGGCVKVLDGIYEGDPDISASVADMFDISNVANITATPNEPLPGDIFGAEPPHTWCYYYEKADLARQMGDWNAILKLKAEADAHNYGPDLAGEYLPFIEAYARTGQWEQAYQLSLAAHEIGKGSGISMCNAWRRFAQFDSNQEMLSQTEKAIQEFCAAGKP